MGAFAPSVSIGSLYPGLTRRRHASVPGVLIPGDGVLESTTVGGTVTFFNIYQNVFAYVPYIEIWAPKRNRPLRTTDLMVMNFLVLFVLSMT